MCNEIAILGVGMHPWGKWGKNFVEYGVVAARAALKDAGVAWRDVQFVSGAATMRCGYPGYVAGATLHKRLAGRVQKSTLPMLRALLARKHSPLRAPKFCQANAMLR